VILDREAVVFTNVVISCRLIVNEFDAVGSVLMV
jgi:hypothetical protein